MRRLIYSIIFLIFLVFPILLIFIKLNVYEYPLSGLIPIRTYSVDLSIQVDGHGEDISITTYLPISDERQRIDNESNSSGKFSHSIESGSMNRILRWKSEAVKGRHSLVYSFEVQSNGLIYKIPEALDIPFDYPEELKEYLVATEGIQVHDPLITQELDKLFNGEGGERGERPGLFAALKGIHNHLQNNFVNMNFSGYTDAITALKLKEASCNGKSRLFVAMARKMNIPARLVGGLILQQGSKKVTHQWVEAFVNGFWVPFDTINDHFAEVPSNYLTLYYGDKSLFRHTSNVNFQYFFKMTKRLMPQREALASLGSSRLNIINFYGLFNKVGISQNLLKIILMLPIGALVTVICRNVIGLETFGTFLPALIAAAARETGLFWGLIGFTVIIFLSSIVRMVLDWMKLLHTPKMAIMLSSVIIAMFSLTILGVHIGLFDLAHITLFPIAIMAITAERLALIEVEQGYRRSMTVLGVTLLVVAACYFAMDSLFLQSMMLAFPELILITIALNMWLGRWMGIRVLEFVRFRSLIMEGK